MYIITDYIIHNGKRTCIKICEPIRCKTLKDVNAVQLRKQVAEQRKRKKLITVFVYYINTTHHNPESDNIGKHDYKLSKWM